MFQINDKVVCVDAGPGKGKNHFAGVPLPLEEGKVYVVRGTMINSGPSGPEQLLYLVGIQMGLNRNGIEYGFWHRRFRKLSEIQAENAAKRAEVCNA